MEISERNDLSITDIIPDLLDIDRNIYRKVINCKEKYCWRAIYNFTDILISSDKDIKDKIEEPLKEIYSILGFCIKQNPSFLKSLSPVKPQESFHPIIKKMCESSLLFNVGPMAAVAGAVNEFIAASLLKYCNSLIIENGGDLFIKTKRDLKIGIYLKNRNFKDKVFIKISSSGNSYGLCSSSSTFGHSLSLGKCDLSLVFSCSSITADAAVTALANRINDSGDIGKSINFFKELPDIKGLLVIKDKKIGIWGDLQLIY